MLNYLTKDAICNIALALLIHLPLYAYSMLSPCAGSVENVTHTSFETPSECTHNHHTLTSTTANQTNIPSQQELQKRAQTFLKFIEDPKQSLTKVSKHTVLSNKIITQIKPALTALANERIGSLAFERVYQLLEVSNLEAQKRDSVSTLWDTASKSKPQEGAVTLLYIILALDTLRLKNNIAGIDQSLKDRHYKPFSQFIRTLSNADTFQQHINHLKEHYPDAHRFLSSYGALELPASSYVTLPALNPVFQDSSSNTTPACTNPCSDIIKHDLTIPTLEPHYTAYRAATDKVAHQKKDELEPKNYNIAEDTASYYRKIRDVSLQPQAN